MTHSFATTEEIRLSALRYAEAALASRTIIRQGNVVTGEYSPEELVEAAKIVESYLFSDSE